MSLDFYLEEIRPTEVFWSNITHNLNAMAKEAGIYDCLWRPDESGFTKAKDIVPKLQAAIVEMELNPDKFRKFDSPNGWGTYNQFLPWVKRVLKGCRENPEATIRVSR